MNKMENEIKRIKNQERICARTLKGRALLCIDYFLAEQMSEDKLMGKLYRLAHCATGTCGNPHEDWVKELEETYKELYAGGDAIRH